MYNVNARKRSRKKGAENFLMRKGITSGGRRSLYMREVFLTFSGRTLLGGKRREASLASGQLGFPFAFRGHWVPPGLLPAGCGTRSCGTERSWSDGGPPQASRVCCPSPQATRIENLGVWGHSPGGFGSRSPPSCFQGMETSVELLPRIWQLTKSLGVIGRVVFWPLSVFLMKTEVIPIYLESCSMGWSGGVGILQRGHSILPRPPGDVEEETL